MPAAEPGTSFAKCGNGPPSAAFIFAGRFAQHGEQFRQRRNQSKRCGPYFPICQEELWLEQVRRGELSSDE